MNLAEENISQEERFIVIEKKQKVCSVLRGNLMKKSTYIYIAILSLWLIAISPDSTGSGPAVLLGEFIGAFGLIYACVLIASKIKGIFKKGNQNV